MKENKIISIIGHFGGNKLFLDGQTVKTKILYDELKEKTNWKILKVDTYYKKKNPIKLIFHTIRAILKSKDIIILLSGNGMKIYFPLLYFCSKGFKKNIYHDVIGGNLDNYVKKYPKYKKYLNEFRCNWVETQGLKNRLEKLGINNCEVIPNFKRLNIVSEEEITSKNNDKKVLKLCTFSRVMREKGISEAIDSVEELNDERKDDNVFLLDIYGPIDSSYEEEFEDKIEKSSNKIRYCGKIPFDESVDILKQYDVLLFPTHWEGEGFPGTIIDAFSAGLPVIATEWNCNSEIIENNLDGIIYPNNDVKNLKEAIIEITSNEYVLKKMKKECLIKANKYSAESQIKKIINIIEKSKKI